MASHNELGDKGEQIALKYLRGKNYEIKETNWRWGKDEIDIIAMDKKMLVIVEVKTRSANYVVKPEFAVNKNKQRFLIRAANSYIFAKDLDLETRFDIVSIVVCKDRSIIEHIEDAFYPIG